MTKDNELVLIQEQKNNWSTHAERLPSRDELRLDPELLAQAIRETYEVQALIKKAMKGDGQ